MQAENKEKLLPSNSNDQKKPPKKGMEGALKKYFQDKFEESKKQETFSLSQMTPIQIASLDPNRLNPYPGFSPLNKIPNSNIGSFLN